MPKYLSVVRSTVATSFALLLLLCLPVRSITFADDPTVCTAPSSSTPGVHTPTDADSVTFTYQCTGQYAGLWTNAHYAYDPATGNRIALDPTTFTYNPQTGLWDYTSWDYSASKGIYVADTLSVNTPPAGSATVGGPAPVASPSQNDSSNNPSSSNTDGASNTPPSTQGSSGSSPDTTKPQTQASTTSPTGSSSLNTNGTFNTTLNNNTGAVMSNVIISGAGSGNSSVLGNTTGGSAATGNAQAISNIINMLQSSSSLNDPNLVTFTANINGDVNGDLLLDPSQIGSVQPSNTTTTLNNNVTFNNSTDATINNNINLDATSGNANVSNNTTGGDASTGNAAAVANIVNILNSAVSAGKSFIGVININGNLNGDILLPPNFVDTLLASNVPHYTVNTSQINNNVVVTNDNNASINNNVNASANSGNATVADNTSGGTATSGSGETNLTVFNLTGSSVVASNDLLVFVNVLGTWYGMILNAPAGTTAAELGGGVTSNTATINNNATLTSATNQTINNNINVNSKSGNANVSNNTSGGNAKTGNASSSINLLNLINDKLSLNGWFGLLFINVYGTWNGSFGINTSAGKPPLSTPQSSGGNPSGQMFQFVPAGTIPGGSNSGTPQSHHQSSFTAPSTNSSGTGTSGASTQGVVLAASTIETPTSHTTVSTPSPAEKATNHFILPALGIALAIIILAAGERTRSLKK